jgi:DNA-binding SARP family transcriptional activator
VCLKRVLRLARLITAKGVPMTAETVALSTIGLLHGFTLTVGDEQIALVWSARRLLAFLALENRSLDRAYVAGALWPESTALKAHANLRTSLWRVNRSGHELIDASVQQLALRSTVAVDVRRAESLARRMLNRAADCDDILTATTRAALSADLLPEWYDDDWLLIEREQFHQLRLYALEAMSERLTLAGRYGEAVDAALAAIRAEPLRESAHKVLIKAHLGAGNRWAAARQFEQCRRMLRDEVGLEPSAELQWLLPRSLELLRRTSPR